MSGTVWRLFAFGATGVSLIVIAYRTLAMIRLPIHLRWELAPIPREKGKGAQGSSYLEGYEWWTKPRHKSRIAPMAYTAKEILLLRGVWEHNRALWPLTFSLHMGTYLILGMLLLQVTSALLIVAGFPLYILDISLGISSVFALGGYLLGTLGTVGLILRRALDTNLRPFNTISRYSNLLFLGGVFISGAYAWLHSEDFAAEMGLFMRSLITLDSSMTVAFPLSLHLIISFLFLLYLPLTDMIHFAAKYFAYHKIRWDDEPQDARMRQELSVLLAQPVTWSATHVKADGKKDWVDIAAEETSGERESPTN